MVYDTVKAENYQKKILSGIVGIVSTEKQEKEASVAVAIRAVFIKPLMVLTCHGIVMWEGMRAREMHGVTPMTSGGRVRDGIGPKVKTWTPFRQY